MSLKYAIAAVMVFLAGCAGIGEIDPNQATIDPNSSVVAFSVDTSKRWEHELSIRPVRLHIQYGAETVSIPLSDGKTGLQRFLLEVPAKGVLLSQVELKARKSIISKRFRTGGRQLVKLSQGEITYLGRLEIADVKFEENADGSHGKPIAIKLVFADELEDDQIVWEQQYRLFQNRVPNQQIVGNWAGQDGLEEWIKLWPGVNSTGTHCCAHSYVQEPNTTQRGPSPKATQPN